MYYQPSGMGRSLLDRLWVKVAIAVVCGFGAGMLTLTIEGWMR